jgi:serine/threonine-protein kinase
MKFFFKTLILFAVFVAVAGISGYLTLRFIIKGEDTVVVPDLVGKDVIYALKILTDLGLNTKVDGFEYEGGVPKNHVAYQDPSSGSVIKKDRDVRIIISDGPKSFVIPNLVGMDIRQAHIIMEESGLSEGVLSRTFSPSAAVDEVISQDPAAGTVAVRGDSIDLLLSRGARPIAQKMPLLEGMTLEDAIVVLERHHLGIGQVRSVLRKDVALDTVVAQDPVDGYQVISGGLVNLTLNRTESGPILGKSLSVLHHSAPRGFLKSHVRIRVNAYGMFYELYDDFAHAGEEIWCLTPPRPESKVFVYENGRLVPSNNSSGERY